MGGTLRRDFFPSGITDCTKQTIDSNWALCTESPTNISLLPLKICSNFNGLTLTGQKHLKIRVTNYRMQKGRFCCTSRMTVSLIQHFRLIMPCGAVRSKDYLPWEITSIGLPPPILIEGIRSPIPPASHLLNQVYQGLDVGSAKPSPTDRKEVPHHLVDILHPSEEYSVGQFYEDARQATRCILDSGRVPIVAGGTGLYLRWFMYGKPDVPKATHEIASQVYLNLADLQRDEDWDAAVQLVVKAGDPKAQFLAVNDWYRLRRSLEIIKSSGSPPSAFRVPYDSFREQGGDITDSSHDINLSADAPEIKNLKDLDYEFVCFFLSSRRVDLYKLIDYRCEDMLSGSDGILSEARWLLDTGLLPNSNSATRAIGYRQAMEYLSYCRQQGGRSSPGEFFAFLSEFQKASRNFAKRQLTWFRNEGMYHWLDASKPLDQVLNFIYDAYYDKTEVLVVPESLRMKKDVSNRRETSELKAYRTKNRHFISRQDCSHILDWIRRTQG